MEKNVYMDVRAFLWIIIVTFSNVHTNKVICVRVCESERTCACYSGEDIRVNFLHVYCVRVCVCMCMFFFFPSSKWSPVGSFHRDWSANRVSREWRVL